MPHEPGHPEKAFHQLQQTVLAVHPFSEEDWHRFSEPWKLRRKGRKQTVTVTGNREPYLYFVAEGVQRIFYLDEQKREATLEAFVRKALLPACRACCNAW